MVPNANQHFPVLPCFLTEFLKIAPPLAMPFQRWADTKITKTASGNGKRFDGMGRIESGQIMETTSTTLTNAEENAA